MATHHGNDGTVKVGSNAIAEIQSFTVTQSLDLAEDTAMGDTSRTYLTGAPYGWEASVECFWDETDTNGQEALTIGASVTLNLYPEGATTGDKYLSGTAIVKQINWSVQRGSIVTRSINCQGNGALSTTSTAA